MTTASTPPFPNLSFPLIRMNRSTSYSQPLMRTPARILILLTALSLHNFAGADLARKFYKAQIGFAKMDVRPTNSSTILYESGLSLGIAGKFAFFDNPDKFSLDFDYGYKYRAISPAKMHRFGVALTPALHVHKFFTLKTAVFISLRGSVPSLPGRTNFPPAYPTNGRSGDFTNRGNWGSVPATGSRRSGGSGWTWVSYLANVA
jgi:hypothetical protein